ncbi:MAG: VOC family protein [Chloroflexota bacterium]
MTIYAIDHIQLAMPPGEEDKARAFYAGLLGFTEVPKPAALAGRGGAWFESGQVRLHFGVESDFRPARKAHPAFLVDDLPALLSRLEASGVTITRDVPLKGYERAHVSDPFGNRIELMEKMET